MVLRPAALPEKIVPGLIVLLVCLCLSVASAEAWTPEGHQVICAIAEDLLDDDTRRETERLLSLFPHVPSNLPAACAWLDHVRSRGVGHFDRWHYVNQPINPAGLQVPESHSDDAVFAIRQSLDTLRDETAHDFGRAFSLRVLIHAVGDIHQPLHTVSRFTAARPEGDRGGNDFPVSTGLSGERDDTLHIFWDRGLGLFDPIPTGDNDSDDDSDDDSDSAEAVRRIAAELRRSVPAGDLAGIDQADPQIWADEGLRLAEEYVYRGIEEGDEPSAEYLRRAEPVVRRQLVLAGYRLAALLDSLPISPSDPPSR